MSERDVQPRPKAEPIIPETRASLDAPSSRVLCRGLVEAGSQDARPQLCRRWGTGCGQYCVVCLLCIMGGKEGLSRGGAASVFGTL
jgi:hypothetical protein